jgi:hypothetical protein
LRERLVSRERDRGNLEPRRRSPGLSAAEAREGGAASDGARPHEAHPWHVSQGKVFRFEMALFSASQRDSKLNIVDAVCCPFS